MSRLAIAALILASLTTQAAPPRAAAPTTAAPSPAAAAPRWTEQTSGVTARFRGISAVSDTVVWASGSNGTIVRTTDGGKTWQTITPPPDTQKLDFRDIDAIDDKTAYVLSLSLIHI